VLDFGLAKALETTDASFGLSQSPTITSPAMMTGVGVILGTAAYMSPEQAKGRVAGKRTDMWAFGCVLYEMLAGQRPFAGDDVTDTLANVLRSDPDWHTLPRHTPVPVRRLLRRCLAKDPKARVADASIARLEIDDAQRRPEPEAAASSSASRGRIVLVSALAVVTLIVAVAVVWAVRPMPSPPEIRLEITTPPTTDPTSLAISPDGNTIVFAATSEGHSQLWLRPLRSTSARPLAKTVGGTHPFWSADSRAVGFFAEGKLKRIDIDSGSVQSLASASGSVGGTWSRNDTILFNPTGSGPIFRVSATGDELSAVTRLQGTENAHRYPQFLPDGRHFVFFATGPQQTFYVGQLGDSTTRPLVSVAGATGLTFDSFGHVLFNRQETLFAQDFDVNRFTVTGAPIAIAENVAIEGGFAALSVSAAGPIIFRSGFGAGSRQFVWFDRSGKEVSRLGEGSNSVTQSLSPDGRRLATDRTVDRNTDIWLLDTTRGSVAGRVTFDPTWEAFPIWSPDGRRVAFSSDRKGAMELYVKSSTGGGAEELLQPPASLSKAPNDWSRDNRFILYRSVDPATGYDLWALPLEGERQPISIARTNANELNGQFSPDSKWVAYESNESSRPEIYVQPFPGPGEKTQVSTKGGKQVRWRADGKELFYLALDNQLIAVPVHGATGGQGIAFGTPISLFTARVSSFLQGTQPHQYAVSSDGQRFLITTLTDEAGTPPITVILNWKARP
jgi:Tol biopolymer transport system component